MRNSTGLIALALAAWLPCSPATSQETKAVSVAETLAQVEPILSLPDGAGVERALEMQAGESPSSPARDLSAYAAKALRVRQDLAGTGPISGGLSVQRDVAVHLVDRRIDALGQAHKAAQVLDPVFAAFGLLKRGGREGDAALLALPWLAADAAAAWNKQAASDTPPRLARVLAERVKDAASSIWPTSKSRLAARRALMNLAETLRSASSGRAAYAWKMRYDLGLEQTPEEISMMGQAEVVRIKARMTALAQELYPDSTLPEAMAKLRNDHPEGDDLAVKAYGSAMRRALAFNERRRLFDVQPNLRFAVKESPIEKGRHPAGAAAYDPASGSVLVALAGNDPRWLAAHNHARVAAIAAHEGFPGHAYQFSRFGPFMDNLFAASRLRGLADGPAVEGYAFYVEKLLAEEGFYSEKERLGQLGMELYRALRLVIDAGLHTGRLTPEQARAMLVEEAFLPAAEAESEVARYLRNPGQALSYFAGYWQIAAMKDAAKAALGPLFAEADFHSAFLSFGPIPLPVIAQNIVGKMRELAASRQLAG